MTEKAGAGHGRRGRLEGQIAVVTGASRGLGRALARQIAQEGARCVLIARTVGGLEELDDEITSAGGLKPLLVPLDLGQLDAIDALGAALHERYGSVDLLVGAAANLGSLSPVGHFKPKVWEDTLRINLTANWRLLRSLDPLLRQGEGGSAFFVTCRRPADGEAFWGLYHASKAGLEELVRSYAIENRRFGLRANLLAPGPFQSALRTLAFPGEDQARLPSAEAVAEACLPFLLPSDSSNGQVIEILPQETSA
ncbi:MAG TPA: SDR family oxidoreductase [Kiloniellales bacterium]|nr:SDR family oxidoreductase [Kiloniellales bacterium]